MELKDQVVSLELAKKLNKLGIKEKSQFKWMAWSLNKEPKLMHNPDDNLMTLGGELLYCVPAYTGMEIGNILPWVLREKIGDRSWILRTKKIDEGKDVQWHVMYHNPNYKHNIDSQYDHSESNARAKMLIYLIENKLINL